ncbi:hypothetical protein JCM11641_007009 [Rhodosporidiobolus odoratus]
MQDAAVAVGGLSALQHAHRALAFLSSAASDIAFSDTTKERTFATLVSALEGLMPARDASLERDTPPHQTQPAAFDADFPHLPHQTLSRPAHLPARPPAPMPAVAEHAQPATIRPATASPDLETHDKLASQMVISVSSLSQPERESYNVPDATLTHLVQGALGSIQAVLKSARRLRLSGDLLLTFSSAAYAATASSTSSTWLRRLHPSLSVGAPLRSHGIVFHAVPSGLNEVYPGGAVESLAECEVVEESMTEGDAFYRFLTVQTANKRYRAHTGTALRVPL